MKIRPLALLVPALALAACAETEPANLAPVEQENFVAMDPVLAPETEHVDLALGEWRESLQQEEPALEFGPQGTEPLFSMVCGEGGGLMLQRHGAVAAAGQELMTVTIGGETRQLAVVPGEGPIPMLRAAVTSTSPLIGALAEVDQPLQVQIGGEGAPLMLPPSPAIGEFVSSCSADAQQRRARQIEQ